MYSYATFTYMHACGMQIMSKPAIGFQEVERVGRVVEVLRHTPHNGFPVFAGGAGGVGAGGRLEGLILRSQLLVLLRVSHF